MGRFFLFLLATFFANEVNGLCGDGWTSYCDPKECYCYKILPTNASWTRAHSECKEMNSNLVSFHSREERDFIFYSAYTQGVHSFWTGLNNLEVDGVNQWSDKTPFDFSDLVKKGDNFSDCYLMQGGGCNSPYWCLFMLESHCSEEHAFVCKKPPVKREVCPYPGKYFCTDEKCSCYYFNGFDRRPWHEAKIECASMGGYLTSIHSQEEVYFIQSLAKGQHNIWTGLRDKNANGQFSWDDGSSLDLLNWAGNEPSNVNETHNCVVANGRSSAMTKWYVDDCNALYDFVCKRDKYIA